MKFLTEVSGRVGNVRFSVWGPWDSPHLWLEILSDRASSRNQWLSCIFSLDLSSERHSDYLFIDELPSSISDMKNVMSCDLACMQPQPSFTHTRFTVVKLNRTEPCEISIPNVTWSMSYISKVEASWHQGKVTVSKFSSLHFTTYE